MESTDEYILSQAEILWQGNWIDDKVYHKIENEIFTYDWYKKGLLLEALRHEIDMQRPWKVGKSRSDYTIDEVLNLKNTEQSAPF